MRVRTSSPGHSRTAAEWRTRAADPGTPTESSSFTTVNFPVVSRVRILLCGVFDRLGRRDRPTRNTHVREDCDAGEGAVAGRR